MKMDAGIQYMNEKLQLMAYGRKISYLKRCIEIVELLNKHETDTSIRCRVFNNHIKPIMKCSYVTFNNMLNEPNPRKQIEDIENKIKLLKNPLPIKVKPITSRIKELNMKDIVLADGGW